MPTFNQTSPRHATPHIKTLPF